MQMKESLILYHTSACHLCEQAEQLLSETLNPDFFEWTLTDIVTDDALVERYGIRIPVLVKCIDGSELGWPFDIAALINFLGG